MQRLCSSKAFLCATTLGLTKAEATWKNTAIIGGLLEALRRGTIGALTLLKILLAGPSSVEELRGGDPNQETGSKEPRDNAKPQRPALSERNAPQKDGEEEGKVGMEVPQIT